MARTLFIVYILALSAGIGLSLFGVFMEVRARRVRLRTKQRSFALMTTKIGVALQSGILLWAIIPSGAVDPTLASFSFLAGTLVALLGLAALSNTTIKEVAEAETHGDRVAAEGQFQAAEADRADSELSRKAGEEYRERGEEYRETGERRREEGEE
jgi:hypothetical protein